MTEIDDPDVLRREIRTMLERVTDRGSLIFFQWLVRRVLANYPITFGVLVAFSGTVTIEEQKYTEENMTPRHGQHRRGVQESRAANSGCGKQISNGIRPAVTAHYVLWTRGSEARRLGGVAAVQTLSRLKRTFPPLKQDTMVLDFVNEQEAIKASFQDYYQRTDLEVATDPNKLYNPKYALEQMRVFTPDDVSEFVELFVVRKATSERLQPCFQRIVTTGYVPQASENKDKFRKEVGRYVRQYSFISQIMTLTDTALEEFYLFTKLLLRQLPYDQQTLPLEVVKMIDMDKYRVQEEQNGRIVLAQEGAALEPTRDDGVRGKKEAVQFPRADNGNGGDIPVAQPCQSDLRPKSM